MSLTCEKFPFVLGAEGASDKSFMFYSVPSNLDANIVHWSKRVYEIRHPLSVQRAIFFPRGKDVVELYFAL